MITYIKDVDTGEIYPVNKYSAKEAVKEVPGYVKTVGTAKTKKWCSIFSTAKYTLTQMVRKIADGIPLLKLLAASVILVCCILGVRFVSSIEFEPTVLQYVQEEQVQEEQFLQGNTIDETRYVHSAHINSSLSSTIESLKALLLRCIKFVGVLLISIWIINRFIYGNLKGTKQEGYEWE